MSAENTLPLLVEPEQLQQQMESENLLIVDLSKADIHAQLHIPGAVHLDYGQIVAAKPPVGGLLPDDAHLSRVLSAIGLTPEKHVIAYDDEGGGKACRLLWTLDCLGHKHYSLLNGGLHAWANEGFPHTPTGTQAKPSHYKAAIQADAPARADTTYILEHLNDPRVSLLDARSMAEFTGAQKFAARAGHIPGAANIEWTAFMDTSRNLRLRSDAQLRRLLEEAEITPTNTVVAYCQTHHRSAHTWFVLKYLGIDAKGYEGSWSAWGNRMDTPIA